MNKPGLFAPEKLNTAVADALKAADLDESKRNAVVVVATYDSEGNVLFKAALSHKVGKYWKVREFVQVDEDKHLTGGIEVKAAW